MAVGMFKLSANKKKYLTLIAKAIGVFLLLVILVFFAFRTYFLNKAIAKVQYKLQSKYAVDLQVGSAQFVGLSGVHLKAIKLIPQDKDTLIDLQEFSLSIHLFYTLFGDARIESIAIKNGYFQLSKKDNISNYAAFLGEQKDSSLANLTPEIEKPVKDQNYAKVLYKLLKRVFNQIPDAVQVENFALRAIDEEISVSLFLKNLQLKEGVVNGNMQVVSQDQSQIWQLSGFANPGDMKADISISSTDTSRLMLPYLFPKYNLQAGFNSARLLVNNINLQDDELHIDGLANVKSLMINHPKISSKEVVLQEFNFDYLYKIGQNYLSLDSSSKVLVNGVTVYPFIQFTNSPDTIYNLVLKTDPIAAQSFIDALPEGLFANIKGMQASGTFSYRLDFMHNENKPNAMVFESNLQKENFVITRYGEANLGKMNGEFSYLPRENGRAMRTIYVGSANPYFTPLEQISPFLRNCILTTEDPSFFYHRGFVTEAFRQSIAKNIRTGKFKRGASTISMQLMKNVFLSREKTMSRKLEEIVLVYILENNRIVSKERMYEVYLNIIEWGPNVYGIGEAARFYFQKSPDKLTLSESMFLATLVPSPKKFMWRFDKEGLVKPYLGRTFGFLSNKMLYRNLLLPEDTVGLTHLINVVGPARKYIIKNDSLANDSLLEIELELIQNGGAREEE
jgi:hypothetical protein